ncbi:sulfite exporter TauE/SafE family protein [Aliiglaciecola sp. M165]|uniref:sulfite exporter TauE/SafE family protein n=1 Tax=Aliiglaciecola sp. M165 TaxID=2593649 RepID=UPI00117F0EED|nr:sulfite exporter TauE/SafE family protein [Aliiglaciecola sp. M165]TRY32853.1 sulfite exporter TauE/SafE family protein [Aliiglaciecola sp. M165]
MDIVSLALVSLFTSTVAGVFGLGGGMLLIAILPFMLPAPAIIPVHAVTQIASNGSRALFSLSDILWRFFPWFIVGSVVGIVLVGSMVFTVPADIFPIAIGLYIIASQWSETFNRLLRRFESFALIGFLQTGLGLIVGATGPLTTTLLKKRSDDKDKIVATNALFMLISHVAKCVVFGFAGFTFATFLHEIIALVVGAIAGSYLGKQLRGMISPQRFLIILKWLLTALALLMITRTLYFLIEP